MKLIYIIKFTSTKGIASEKMCVLIHLVVHIRAMACNHGEIQEFRLISYF
jgi:hypothetical protein